MVKVDNSLVLNVPNFRSIIDMVLAIPTLLCDRTGVALSRRWNDLYFNPDSKNAFHISRVDEEVPHGCHAAVVNGVIFNDKNLAIVFLKFCEFVEQIFATFRIANCFGRGNLLEISIHNREGKLIPIHISFDCELLCIAQGFLTALQTPCRMERIMPLPHRPVGTPGNIFSALLFLCWVGLYLI